MLRQFDVQRKGHLAAMRYLRQGIHLRGYAQKNPEQEYKAEAFAMFVEILDRVKRDVISIVSRVQTRSEKEVEAIERRRRPASAPAGRRAATAVGTGVRADYPRGEDGATEPALPVRLGKEYKHCHGKLS